MNIFLSYDHRDAELARPIASALEKAGHDVWWDRHIRGGSQFAKEIERALAEADVVVVVWSERSIESPWVRDEAEAARDSGRLVPVRIDQSRPPLGFRQFQAIDFSGTKGKGRASQIQALLHALDHHRPTNASQTQHRPARHDRENDSRRLTRRSALTGIAVVAALGAGGFWAWRGTAPRASPQVQSLLDQAWQAWTQGDGEGLNQAIGLYRRATELDPNHADSWGLLGAAYADRAHWWVEARERPALRDRAREAAQRALKLDPKNANARAAMAYARPFRGSWLHMDREFRKAIADQPGAQLVTYSLALLLGHVGRMRESAAFYAQLDSSTPTANQSYFHSLALWSSGQLGEAERLVEQAAAIYATHPRIWTARYNLALVGGRPAAALAMAEDRQSRPSRLTEEWLSRRAAVARALTTGAADQLSTVTAELLEDAKRSANDAGRSMQDLAILGRLDEAFAVADAYFFSRGFVVPDLPAAPGGRSEANMESRATNFLFVPATQAMRADPRFEKLVEELGLSRYWRETGSTPDYRRQG